MLLNILFFLFGYLCGSIPFGLVLSRFAGLGDVRNIGSGNIGATNVLRTGNKKLAAFTLLGDALKGTVAVLIASRFGPEAAMMAGLGAFIGHLFPVWLKFKGGKGIAVYVGLLLAFWWQGLAAFALVWLGIAYFTRYSSLASLCATLAAPVAFWLTGRADIALLFAILTVLAWLMHRTNISRLLAGTEGKIGAKG